MELSNFIRKKILSVKLQNAYPSDLLYQLRQDLTEAYVVGWEQGKYEINQHTNKPIGQFRDGVLINIFKSRVDAAKKTGFTEAGIKKAMYRGTPMIQGWTWRYLKDNEIPNELKKPIRKSDWLTKVNDVNIKEEPQ